MNIRKKLIGSRAFYAMVLGVVVPIMIQNGITNFVSLLDNIMVGRTGNLVFRQIWQEILCARAHRSW